MRIRLRAHTSKRRLLTRAAGSLAAVLFAVALVPVGAGPAQAEAAFDLYALRSPGLHINSGSCRHITVTARTDAPSSVSDVDAQVDLWLGRSQVDSVDLSPVDGNVRRLSGYYYYCPHLDEPGQYRLGSTEVTWYDQDYDSASFIDASRGTMIAKQATSGGFTGTRTGATRTFHAHLRYFYSGWSDYYYYPDGWYDVPHGEGVALQRRAGNGSGTWKRVAFQRTDTHGRVAFTLRAARVFQYRITSPGTEHSWPLASLALRR